VVSTASVVVVVVEPAAEAAATNKPLRPTIMSQGAAVTRMPVSPKEAALFSSNTSNILL